MNMKKTSLLTTIILLAAALPLGAQFYSGDSEPSRLKWSHIVTGTYDVIYPQGMDSLGKAYATALENVAAAVGATAGYTPNQMYQKPLPVLLHPFNTVSNGMVTWTPRRMELQTTPEAYAPMPLPWVYELAIHESRHAAQMQYVNDAYFRPFGWFSGQLVAGALAALYCGPSFFEGDAVVTETALSSSGRGRSADFLEYYRTCFSGKEFRSWWQWRYGSLSRYTPDHYTIGYITAAGVRALYDAPDFTARYYARLRDRFFPIMNFQKTIREVGGASLGQSFAAICDSLAVSWERDRAVREPFDEMERIVPEDRHFIEYRAICSAGDKVYAIRSGIASDCELVELEDNGRVSRICRFSPLVDKISGSAYNGLLWWSEKVRDKRWPSIWYSVVRYLDRDGIVKTLVEGTRWFNPAPSPDSDEIALASLEEDGSAHILVVDSMDGRILRSIRVPDGLQPSEVQWLDGSLYAFCTSLEGNGLYKVDSGFATLMSPVPVNFKGLFAHDGRLCFTADFTGENELYSISADSGSLLRMTNTAQGASEFCVSPDGESLLCSILSPGGRYVHRIPLGSLGGGPSDPAVRHEYPFAEKLSEAEPLKIAALSDMSQQAVAEDQWTVLPYSKSKNLLDIHSWVPAYADYDRLASMSGETLYRDLGLGATVFFQNTLDSFEGFAGWHLGGTDGTMRSSGHLSATMKSLPVCLEGRLDFNDRNAHLNDTTVTDKPLVSGKLAAYLPLLWYKSGWSTGFIPQLSLSLTNDMMDISIRERSTMSRALASVRAYRLRPVPSSRIYPEFGIGMEAGYAFRPGLSMKVSPDMFLSLYSYLPGFAPLQGMRLTALLDKRQDFWALPDPTVYTTPRGFGNDSFSDLCYHSNQLRLTLDYAIPFASLDWDRLCPVAYLRNLELIPHADLGYYWSPAASKMTAEAIYEFEGASETLWSVGASFSLVLGNLAWLPYQTRVGIDFSYKSGRSFLAERDGKHFFIGPVFSIDM